MIRAIARVIRGVNADIVGLQELNQNTAKKLIQELAVDYPYHAIMPPNQKQQVGIFSRFPIVTATTFSLPTDSQALQAVVRVYNQFITKTVLLGRGFSKCRVGKGLPTLQAC